MKIFLSHPVWTGIGVIVAIIFGLISLMKNPSPPPKEKIFNEQQVSASTNSPPISISGNGNKVEIKIESMDMSTSTVNNCFDENKEALDKEVVLKVGEEMHFSKDLTVGLEQFDFSNLSCDFIISSRTNPMSERFSLGDSGNLSKVITLNECRYNFKLLESSSNTCKLNILSLFKEN